MKVSDHHGSFLALSARGDFGGEPRGSTPKSVFPMLARPFGSRTYLARARKLCNLSLLRSPSSLLISYFLGMAAFTSTVFYSCCPACRLRRNLNPPLSTFYATAQFTRVLFQTLRVNAITDRDTFVNMFDSKAALKEGASDLGFDLTSGGLPHKREFARVVTSWKTAKVMSETKLQTDAVARAHGVPVTLLPCDWTSLDHGVQEQAWQAHILDDKLPAQSMFENFSERLADGTLKAEPLSHVVSLFEEEQQDAKRPDPTRQYNLQLDSKLTITTKRRHLSSEPTDEKGLRLKYSILTNLWLLAQMRQPGRSIYADFDRNTFTDFLETLLDKDNFNFYKEVDGRPMISPSWTYCLSYEFELRKEAIRLCKEQSFGIQSALWATLRNTEHRMKHWLQLVAIPNAPSSPSSQELHSLKKRISDLEKARSRSPRRSNQKQITAPGGSQMLALPAPSAPAQGRKGGKPNRRAGARNTASKGSGKGQASKDFDYLMKLFWNFVRTFMKNFTRTRFALDSRRRPASVQMGHASSRMCAWAAAVRSLTTTASASPQSSHEPHLLQSLTQSLRFNLPCPFPRWFPL